ncbi:hypothetical protein JCM10450v2_007139 [Rhodotorula kratochvilovae]
MPNPMIVEAAGKHTASIIFAHGLGDSAQGWYPLARALAAKKQFAHIRWVLPTAFDIQDLNPRAGIIAEDDAGMLASVRTITALVSAEVDAGIPAERVLVGGFSQGAVISYLVGLTSERKLAGVAALSGFLGMAGKVKSMMTDHAAKLPIFHGHGDADEVVQYKWGKQTVDTLKELGVQNLDFRTYRGMGHSICPEEQADLEAFIAKVLPADS